MLEQEALARMVPPGKRRPGAYRGGIIQIHLTRLCDKACANCTQGSQLSGKSSSMTPELFEQACQSLQGYWGVVGIFGGNPVLNKHFEEICGILQRYFPKEQRGLWCNKLHGKGAICRATFDPAHSNLNVHLDREAEEEFRRDWPEALLVGQHTDSRHSPPWVAMQDITVPGDSLVTTRGIRPGKSAEQRKLTEDEMWTLTAGCDINQNWSALIGVFRGELRAYFCEIAGAQAMLHQFEPDYPDLGMPVAPGWWQRSMADFAAQARYHCRACGVPLRGYGALAVSGDKEQVSQTHASIYKPKVKDREVELVTELVQLGAPVGTSTQYIQNAAK